MVLPLENRAITSSLNKELDQYVAKSWDGSGGNSHNELWTEEFKAWIDGHMLKSLFYSEDWVFSTTDLIANKISSLPLKVMRKIEKDGQEVEEPVEDHPLNDLLEQPNEHQAYSEWMYQTTVELFLMGNAIIWSAPNSGQLITLTSENISMDFDTKGQLNNYILTSVNSDGSNFTGAEVQATFKKKDIIHVRRPNPNSMLWGLSPWIPGRKSVLFNRYSSDYLNAFYLKQATPGLALEMDRAVNEDVALRQLRSFEVAYQGRKNQRRTLVLPKGVKATPLSHSLADQKLLDHINSNRESILALLKIPKHEVGLQTAGSLGSEEYKTALRNFWESTLKPAAKMVAGSLTKHFQNDLEGAYFKFDLSQVEALQEDLKTKAEIAIAMLNSGLSINEVRGKVWQVEASEMAKADMPYPLTTQLPTLSLPQGEEPQEPQEPQEEKSLRTKLVRTATIEERVKQCCKSLEDEEAQRLGSMSEKAIDLLTGLTGAAIDVLDKTASKGMQTKADLPSDKVLARRIRRAMNELFEESWANDVARTLSTSVEVGYDSQIDLVFNQEARNDILALKLRDAEKRRLTLEARGLESFENISKTHTERIMREITKANAAGESITNVMRAVADSLGTPGQLRGKAEVIARTETLIAASIGQAAALDNATEVIPNMKKAWLSAGDDRVRDSHQDLDGDVVDAKATFANDLRYPRDVKGEASEVINCRCTLLLVSPDDEDILTQGV